MPCDRPGLHRDPADVEELRSARAITRLDGQAADDRVDEGGQRVDIDIARHIAIPNAFSDARCKVDLRSRSILSHHVADGAAARPKARSIGLTWTADNLSRQTVYVGLRGDKPVERVRRELKA
jgi:hypothetical protein